MTNESAGSPSQSSSSKTSYLTQLSPLSPHQSHRDGDVKRLESAGKSKALNCMTSDSDENSASTSSSISPISASSDIGHDAKSGALKRNRESSLESAIISGHSSDVRNHSASPPSKSAKVSSSSYSIMNILGNGNQVKSFSNKENSAECSEVSSKSLSPESQLENANGQQMSSTINPFLMNPFLAAAAAAAAQASGQPSGQMNGPMNAQSSLLNNISNLALLSNLNAMGPANLANAGKQAEFWPWLNMAAVSALYGMDSKCLL